MRGAGLARRVCGDTRGVGWGPPASTSGEEEELAAWQSCRGGRRPRSSGMGRKAVGPLTALFILHQLRTSQFQSGLPLRPWVRPLGHSSS